MPPTAAGSSGPSPVASAQARRPVDQSGRPLGPRAQETRRRILEATAALLAQRSVREIRVVEIARKVGTSPATFYQYFKGVEEAILRLVEQAAEDMPRIIGLIEGSWDGQQGQETARAIADAFVHHWDTYGPVLRVRNLKAEEGDRRFRKARLGAMSPVVASLAGRMEAFQREGRVSRTLHPWAAAAAVVAMLERMSNYHANFERAGVTREALVETCARIVQQTVSGGVPS